MVASVGRLKTAKLVWFLFLTVFLCHSLSGDIIPADSILHFDVLMLDIWNTEDKVQIKTYHKPESCGRTVEVSDYVRYHYNGTLLDGTLFDSRWDESCEPKKRGIKTGKKDR